LTRRPTPPPLTKSERTLLCLLANGRTITQLTAELHLSRHTLNTHRSNLYRKLGVHGIGEAVDAAFAAGVIAPADIVTGPIAVRLRMAGLERANRVLRRQLKDAAVQLALMSGEPCAGGSCSHERVGAELGTLEAEIESGTVAASCGPACSEGHTYYGRCVLQSGDEMGDALRRVADDVARHRAGETAVPAETPDQLHARFAHPGWEYATTIGPRKQWDDADVPPDGDGWERNMAAGRDGWERWDYTEESYWRRPVTGEGSGQ
jgi:DNA-binding CsgD family transcriptional regulator